mmetsp:Transcript_39861/g.85027  ORF Transcript_39861/g.85027 Transcript_39861/m.85027 type:complete len:233 (-) Transcript_39861:309-1007(-)
MLQCAKHVVLGRRSTKSTKRIDVISSRISSSLTQTAYSFDAHTHTLHLSQICGQRLGDGPSLIPPLHFSHGRGQRRDDGLNRQLLRSDPTGLDHRLLDESARIRGVSVDQLIARAFRGTLRRAHVLHLGLDALLKSGRIPTECSQLLVECSIFFVLLLVLRGDSLHHTLHLVHQLASLLSQVSSELLFDRLDRGLVLSYDLLFLGCALLGRLALLLLDDLSKGREHDIKLSA